MGLSNLVKSNDLIPVSAIYSRRAQAGDEGVEGKGTRRVGETRKGCERGRKRDEEITWQGERRRQV